MARLLPRLAKRIRAQLRHSDSLPDNFYAQAVAAKERIKKALQEDDLIAARSAAAAYGGLVKRWRRWLIENITLEALADVETSRAGVRKWQARVFRRSIASSALNQFGNPDHSGGGRVGQIQLDEKYEQRLSTFYNRYAKALKAV